MGRNVKHMGIVKFISNTSFAIWVLSVLTFIILFYYGGLTSETSESAPALFKLWEDLSRISILGGIISFMIFFIASLIPFGEKSYKQAVKNLSFLVLGSGFVLVALAMSVPAVKTFGSGTVKCKVGGEIVSGEAANCSALRISLQNQQLDVSSELPTIGNIAEEATLGDGLIDCTFPNSGSIRMSREQCSRSTDCQLGDSWKVYPSAEECKVAQEEEIISCTFDNATSVRMKRSECRISFECKVGDNWKIYTSAVDCAEAMENYWEEKKEDDQDYTYEPPQNSYYSGDGVYDTYDDVFTEVEPWDFSSFTQTFTPEEESCDIGDVREAYSTELGNCSRRFQGGSSAYDACVYVTENYYEPILNSCN